MQLATIAADCERDRVFNVYDPVVATTSDPPQTCGN